MNHYKKFVPIIALILIAFGINLDKFGIDLNALSRGESVQFQLPNNDTGNTLSTQTLDNTHSNDTPLTSSSQHPSYKKWSDTEPNINLWHVFEGEINRQGKPVGFHSRPGGIDPANAKLLTVRDKPNRAGVYTAQIAVRDGNQWLKKFSSLFPDTMSKDDVVETILHAYNNSKNPKKQPWEGPSGKGFNIQGYTSSRGGINTAFPVYVRSQ